MPVIGIMLLSAGAANLGVKLFNKSARGQDWEVALASMYSDHIIVCGLGKLGYRVTLQLLEFGQSVVAIEREADKDFIASGARARCARDHRRRPAARSAAQGRGRTRFAP